jgi:hypothetical protein
MRRSSANNELEGSRRKEVFFFLWVILQHFQHPASTAVNGKMTDK